MASVASDSSLDDLSIDDTWETELEIALLGTYVVYGDKPIKALA